MEGVGGGGGGGGGGGVISFICHPQVLLGECERLRRTDILSRETTMSKLFTPPPTPSEKGSTL